MVRSSTRQRAIDDQRANAYVAEVAHAEREIDRAMAVKGEEQRLQALFFIDPDALPNSAYRLRADMKKELASLAKAYAARLLEEAYKSDGVNSLLKLHEFILGKRIKPVLEHHGWHKGYNRDTYEGLSVVALSYQYCTGEEYVYPADWNERVAILLYSPKLGDFRINGISWNQPGHYLMRAQETVEMEPSVEALTRAKLILAFVNAHRSVRDELQYTVNTLASQVIACHKVLGLTYDY
jgi:hypothetical protein